LRASRPRTPCRSRHPPGKGDSNRHQPAIKKGAARVQPTSKRPLPYFGAPIATEMGGAVPATGCRPRCRTDQGGGRRPPIQGRRPAFGAVTTITCIKAWLGTAHAGRSAEFLGPHGKEVVRVWPISTN
jgi:hypothetical protein